MTGLWQFVMSLYQGSTAYVAARQSGSRFMAMVRQNDIEFCIINTAVYKQPASPDDARNVLKRANIYGFPKGCHEDLERRFGVRAREGYGMTEIGAGTYTPLDAPEIVGSGSCGVPMPFRQLRIVGADGNEVARGHIGELLVKGPGIFHGYYKNAAATESAFTDGWFKTGDLFRQDDDGNYYIVGRIKDMIRRAGENVAAVEVETVLMELPEVVEAAVVPVPDDLRGEEIKAYLVLDGVTDEAAFLDKLFAHCRERLAIFKVPRYIQFHPGPLPKTASGKLSKAPLKAENGGRHDRVWDRVEEQWQPAVGA